MRKNRRRSRLITIRMSLHAAATVDDMLGWELQTRDPEFGKCIEGRAALAFRRAFSHAMDRERTKNAARKPP